MAEAKAKRWEDESLSYTFNTWNQSSKLCVEVRGGLRKCEAW